MLYRAQKPILSKLQSTVLDDIIKSRTSQSDHIQRANIIVKAAQGCSDRKIANDLNIGRMTVATWRRRWLVNNECLESLDEHAEGVEYKRGILKILSDAQRPGVPPKFSPEQICQIINIACEQPSDLGVPLSHWSLASLTEELIKRGVVESISTSQLSVFLNEAKIKPHRVKEWIHTPVADEAAFNQAVHDLCEIYKAAPEMHEKGVHVISCDEKTGMQALERMTTPLKPGQYERQDNTYTRHGTQCLIANFEVATGRVIMPSIGDTRTESDFAQHIRNTINSDPKAEWIIVVDQLNTHKSESLVRFVSEACALNIDLGEKGKSGILKNMETRADFLSDTNHRIRLLYTPKHASWLNQIEVWFSILSSRLLKRLSVCSTSQLKNKVMDFVDYFNKTAARAFKWTYSGRPLAG